MTILAGCFSATIAGFVLRRKVSSLLEDGTSVATREILATSLPLLVSTATALIFMQADLWIVGSVRPEAEVGLYGAAWRLAVLLALPLRLVNWVAAPLVAEYYALRRIDELERNLRAAAALASVPAFAVLILFVASAPLVLGQVYGPFYTKASWVLALLSVGQFASVWLGSCNLALVMTGHQQSMMLITVVSGLLSLFLSLVLVHRFGIVGVALASAAGTVVQNVWMLLSAKALTGIWTHASVSQLGSVSKELLRDPVRPVAPPP